jgi:D-alanyl-lipoteichoic acid acyltransferase DltB (MBOAT superfamily)
VPLSSVAYFCLFLPIVALGNKLLLKAGATSLRQLWLVVASVLFYSFGNLAQLWWLLASIAANHLIDRRLAASASAVTRKRWLILGLSCNICVLCAAKYTDFLLANLDELLGRPFHPISLALPLGLSFFTIQQIMYLVDRYQGLARPSTLLEYATFVSFFATITCGPLTKAKQFVEQLQRPSAVMAQHLAKALALFSMGLCKKVIIADACGRIADAVYEAWRTASGAELWLASVSYSCQIYFDFSGYSDMAIASGLVLGLAIPNNFDAPYRACSIPEFWQRWHLTLSQFITSYLYTPILRTAGKITLLRACWVTMLAMGIAGLWHGPAWTFVFFGLLHGLGIVTNLVWRKKVKLKLPRIVAWGATMAYVNLTFILFRAGGVRDSFDIIARLGSPVHFIGADALRRTIRGNEVPIIAVPVVVGLLCSVLGPTSQRLSDLLKPTTKGAVLVAGLFLLGLLFANSNMAKQFVYQAF